ncbi:MAG: hypothetical protein GY811_24575 [Myxococcales bacterium]|nr:hypothetical protein [Myxococcales bacterium]
MRRLHPTTKAMPPGKRNSAGHAGVELPSEHGFWVMLVVVLVATVARAEFSLLAMGMALGQAVFVILMAGQFHRQVRKNATSQVVASAALGLLLLPIEWGAKLPSLDPAFAY